MSKRKIPTWAMGVIAAFLAVGILTFVVVKTMLPGEPSTKQKVRDYLSETLDDPNFEEIEWGPLVQEEGKADLISLRYRAKNEYNAWQMRTDLFMVGGDSVLVIEDADRDWIKYPEEHAPIDD